MPTISKEQAAEMLRGKVTDLPADDLIEVYNELFPEDPATEIPALVDRVVAHLQRGLEVEEILDLWTVVFPKYRHASYDEETETIHYYEEAELIPYAE